MNPKPPIKNTSIGGMDIQETLGRWQERMLLTRSVGFASIQLCPTVYSDGKQSRDFIDIDVTSHEPQVDFGEGLRQSMEYYLSLVK